MEKKSVERKIDSARLNVEVCSILIAAISISFGLSDLSRLFDWTRFLIAICLGLGGLFLITAIILEADAVFQYSRRSEDLGDDFDRYGYQSMKWGLLFSLITFNYIVSPLFPAIIELPFFWSRLSQATLPIILAVIPFLIWKISKNRILGLKWYRIW